MDFTLKPEVEDFRKRIRNFVETHVIPLETDPASYDKGDNITEDLMQSLRSKAKSEGLWALSMPLERCGQGLNKVGMA